MDDFLASSELCDERGLARAAGLLRAAADGKAYLVLERGYEYQDFLYELDARATPRQAYPSRDEAERAARLENGRAYRRLNLRSFGESCFNDPESDLARISPLPPAELSARLSAILGRPFDVVAAAARSGHRALDASLFPGWATDEQMAEIVGLFHLRFFEVVEVEFAP